MMVIRRRAPIFSIRWFACDARSAIASMADSSKLTCSPSTSSKSCCCLVSELSGSVRMRMKSSLVSDLSSTRMENLPWSSGMRSVTAEVWNAPAAMNRIWSVLTVPLRVLTVEPSTMGRRSRWTPCLETSGEPLPEPGGVAILSISSRNTMPDCSVRWIAACVIFSLSTSFSVSWSIRIFRAILTVTFLCFVSSGIIFSSMFDISGSIWSIPIFANMTDACGLLFCDISTSLLSSFPESSCSRMRFRVDSRRSAEAWVSTKPCSLVTSGRGGKSRSMSFSSAAFFALTLTSLACLACSSFRALSRRSRIMDSTSLPW